MEKRKTMFDIDFWKNFLSNALATFMGAIIGIPIALWLNQLQQKSSERYEKAKEQLKISNRKKKILSLIKSELEFNLEFFSTDEDGKYIGLDNFSIYRFKIESWESISDGGEIQWIQDLDILSAISTAYYSIRRLMSSHELFTLSGAGILASMPQINFCEPDKTFKAIAHQHLKRNSDVALQSIKIAIKVIDEELNKNS